MIIDAKGLILGRLAAFAAKQALLGEKVDIINCEEAVISGQRQRIIADNLRKRNLGNPIGPIYSRSPDRFVRRTIRGMLPHKQPKGRDAYKRIMCYIGGNDTKDAITIDNAKATKLPLGQSMTIKELCKSLGGK